ncbi:MAG TPA: cysteine synthase A [Methanomassiliicoccales archaeon]|nr:cysteine synthase A [Methanomassiliicoccales archaeon]
MRYNSILEAVGRTPMVKLNKMVPEGAAEVHCKLEFLNPTGSVKDRAALAMIEDAERRGVLKPGMCVVEPTSGNTGIGLAMVCAVKGYRLILTMPESMTEERRKFLKAMGAELVLTPTSQGMGGAVACAEDVCCKQENTFMPQQFENPSNPSMHERTTGLELLEDLPDVDAFVAGVGTGGTVTGVGRALKKARPECIVIAVEPLNSPVLSGGQRGPHEIQGLGAGFVPKVFDRSVVDHFVTVSNDDAKKRSRELARLEGLFVGISAGANVHVALKIAEELGQGRKVATVLPDSGQRYLSTDLFQQ